MKLVRKWLFPALTCLIVLGAAALPPYLSQLRDARQFDQVHTEALEADGLPVAQPPTLLDRMELFANHQYSPGDSILSSNTGTYTDSSSKAEQALALRRLLTGQGIIPEFFFEEYTGSTDEAFEYCGIQRLLLWDPAGEQGVREPFRYYLFAWNDYETYHSKSLSVDVDAETGLPIQVLVYDTDIAQWCPYSRDALDGAAFRFFEMMGWTVWEDVVPMEPPEPENKFFQLCFAIPDTDLYYWFTHGPTTLNITLNPMGDRETGSGSSAFDG